MQVYMMIYTWIKCDSAEIRLGEDGSFSKVPEESR
jgi:hypothetical protein